jgi:endonuclease G
MVIAPLLAENSLKYGQPDCKGKLLDKKYYVLCYDTEHKIPAWVGYALSRDDVMTIAVNRKESGFQFRPDPEIPAGGRAANSDYSGKGYDKGHMAPANDFRRSAEAMKATFILSNAVPQNPTLNRGQWKLLEAAVQRLAESRGTIWVFSGPVFMGGKPMKTIGSHHVAVATHTFKVILCVHADGSKEMFSYLYPNTKPTSEAASYALSVKAVEKITGLDFFSALPTVEQKELEAETHVLP